MRNNVQISFPQNPRPQNGQSTPTLSPAPDVPIRLPNPRRPIRTYEGRAKGEYEVFLNRLNSYFQENPAYFPSEFSKVACAITFLSPTNRALWLNGAVGARNKYTWSSFKDFCHKRVGEAARVERFQRDAAEVAREGGLREEKLRKDAALRSLRSLPAAVPSAVNESNYGRLEPPPSIAPPSGTALPPRPDMPETHPPNPTVIVKFEGTGNGEYETFMGQLNEYFALYPRYFSSEQRRVTAAVNHLCAVYRDEWLRADAPRWTWEGFKEFCQSKLESSRDPSIRRSLEAATTASWKYSHCFQSPNQTVTDFASELATIERGLAFPYAENQRKVHLLSKSSEAVYNAAKDIPNLPEDYGSYIKFLQAVKDAMPARRGLLGPNTGDEASSRGSQRGSDSTRGIPPPCATEHTRDPIRDRVEPSLQIHEGGNRKRLYPSYYDGSIAWDSSPRVEDSRQPKQIKTDPGRQVLMMSGGALL